MATTRLDSLLVDDYFAPPCEETWAAFREPRCDLSLDPKGVPIPRGTGWCANHKCHSAPDYAAQSALYASVGGYGASKKAILDSFWGSPLTAS